MRKGAEVILDYAEDGSVVGIEIFKCLQKPVATKQGRI